MSATLRATMVSLSALLLGFGFMQAGNTLQGTLLSVRGSNEGFSHIAIGVVGAAFWAGIVLGSLLAGTLIRRVGQIRSFAAREASLTRPRRATFGTESMGNNQPGVSVWLAHRPMA
jgi:MFS family permease